MKIMIPIITIALSAIAAGAQTSSGFATTQLDAQEGARKQLEEARHQVDNARRDLEKQLSQLGQLKTGGAAGWGGASTVFMNKRLGLPEASSPLIVQFSKTDPTDFANVGEDLTVMRRILDKAVDEGPERHATVAMGIDVYMPPMQNGSRTIYVEGQGALFVLEVGYPLLGLAKIAEDTKSSGTNSSAWDEARKEVLGLPDAAPGNPPEPFDPDKVTKLQDRLLTALKNASNIRVLKPEESVTVCVIGAPNSGQVPKKARRAFLAEIGADSKVHKSAGSVPGASDRTIMTLRASKADIDAVAGGKISGEEFAKRLKTATYADESQSAEHPVGMIESADVFIGASE